MTETFFETWQTIVCRFNSPTEFVEKAKSILEPNCISAFAGYLVSKAEFKLEFKIELVISGLPELGLENGVQVQPVTEKMEIYGLTRMPFWAAAQIWLDHSQGPNSNLQLFVDCPGSFGGVVRLNRSRFNLELQHPDFHCQNNPQFVFARIG